jgi:hypothetical protein
VVEKLPTAIHRCHHEIEGSSGTAMRDRNVFIAIFSARDPMAVSCEGIQVLLEKPQCLGCRGRPPNQFRNFGLTEAIGVPEWDDDGIREHKHVSFFAVGAETQPLLNEPAGGACL